MDVFAFAFIVRIESIFHKFKFTGFFIGFQES